MEDSPLSITANIAGLLTFVVAILASIYVRVLSLRNGKVELETIRKSVEKNVNDLLEMVQETTPIPTPPFPPSPTFSGWDRRNSQDEETDAVRLKKLSVSLSTTEIIIYIYCWYAMDMDKAVKKATILRPVLSSLRDAEGRGGAYPGALLEILQMQVRILSIENIFQPFWNILPSHWEYPKKLLNASQRILTVGSSPTLIRWYRVREMVLEKVRHTEMLRSQILSLQVSMANSSADRSEEALQRLIEQQAEVKARLEELTRLVVTASQAPVRLENMSVSGIPAETHVTVSPGQQEDVERHVGDEGSQLETTDCCE